MERKRSSAFRRIFTAAFDIGYFRLDNVNDCPAGSEPLAVAENRTKATVKIRRNPLLRFLSMIPKTLTP